ncbi:hypothetical protein HYR99_11615 [Candidatus Poribacteria bacterium]|nr:hypothetical protein [Candidatus Poribacteria bacterium]
MGRKIEVKGPGGDEQYDGSYDKESRTITTTDGRKVHPGANDRVTEHSGCLLAITIGVGTIIWLIGKITL